MANYLLSCFFSCLLLLVCLKVGVVGNEQTGTTFMGEIKLRIGVPMKEGFTQFVKVKWNTRTYRYDVTGFCIDVFKAVLQVLPFKVNPQFEPFVNGTKWNAKSAGTYTQLLHQIPQKYDAVVGDVTIVADRAAYVDFTLPFTETGVRMIVRVQHGKHINMWIFLRPFSWDLWLTLTLVCVFIGVVIRIMERNVNMSELNGSSSSPQREQLTAISILWLPLSQAVIPQRELVAKNCSRFVLVVWLILACVLMQSYTASLSSILTIDRLKPNYPTTNELIRKGYQVGYQNGSFVGEQFLKQRLKFDPTKLKPLDTISDYHRALRNGIVEAIYDEIPFIKVFLKKFGSNYMMVGPTYRTDGLSFAFPYNSSLTSFFSRAILNVTQSDVMDRIEKKYFGSNNWVLQAQDVPGQFSSDSPTPSLTAHCFAGLFMLTGIATFLALLVSESFIWKKPIVMANNYRQRYLDKRQVGSIDEGNIVDGDGQLHEDDNVETPQAQILPITTATNASSEEN
ncbi:Glutamate receptor-like protein [Quillaja saponaria]|uniref:Glutamate receptor-like protein n=1 Tax=Quillaja saponaria TaxID=32244 RepID=A0AAD7QDG9_QUISA|nr:Glutamate receptor-like protein [Quillaja saponaria]